jgi:hypothetical protein
MSHDERKRSVMSITKALGAQFEISIDGTPRTHRDIKARAIEAAEYLKRKHPNSAVMVKDLQSGETIAVEYKPDLGAARHARGSDGGVR